MRDKITPWTSSFAQRLPFYHKSKDKLKLAFTLIEALIVTCLIVIIAAIAIPPLLKSENDVLAQLETIEAICSYLQQRAMASNSEHELLIDTKAHTYAYMAGNQKHTLPLNKSIQFGFIETIFGPPAHPQSPILSACTFPKRGDLHVLTFYPTGILAAGTVYFIDTQKRHLGALTSSVSQVSYIRRYYYTNNKWSLVSA